VTRPEGERKGGQTFNDTNLGLGISTGEIMGKGEMGFRISLKVGKILRKKTKEKMLAQRTEPERRAKPLRIAGEKGYFERRASSKRDCVPRKKEQARTSLGEVQTIDPGDSLINVFGKQGGKGKAVDNNTCKCGAFLYP